MKKGLFDKLVFACEDEILNTIETIHDNKAAICENNWLMQTMSLVIICTLLLASVSIGCYYYYTRHWKKEKHLLPFSDTSNKLKGIYIYNMI